MKKHPKLAYGISEDGLAIRLACLSRDDGQVRLNNLDIVELDKPLYRTQDQLTGFDNVIREDTQQLGGDLQFEEFEAADLPTIKAAPWERMLANALLHKGVLALNVNEENLVRGTDIPTAKAVEKDFVRANLDPGQLKSGEWQTSRFAVNGNSVFLLHRGANLLLQAIAYYGKRNRKNYYYQLADANDIALADLYRISNPDDGKRALLVYLGRDYRKAFLFVGGHLQDVYPLNITQDFPEPELLFSRVTLALDNSQQAEPEKYVICGDLASHEVVEYFHQHSAKAASLLTYPQLAVDGLDRDLYNPLYLAQFALPLALALKAISPEDGRFTQSNFLPGYLMEAQKPFKIGWHGYLIMIAIFGVALLGTITFLNSQSQYKEAFERKRALDHELAVLRIETAEIAKMRAEMQYFSKNMDAIRLVLKGKNPWSLLLDTLNRQFQSRPYSWLTNMKKEGSRLLISGVTLNRANVIAFAEALPQSRIQKVTSSQIHGKTVWTFEISSDLPEVDWVGQIENEMTALMEQRKIEEELRQASEQEQNPDTEAAAEQNQPLATSPATPTPVEKAPPTPVADANTVPEKAFLEPIATQYMPPLTTVHQRAGVSQKAAYNEFIHAINQGDLDATKKLGNAFLAKYPGGALEPMVRWHLSNKLYRAGEYNLATEVLDPLVHYRDGHYPYAMLLAARINYAKNGKRYPVIYAGLLKEFPSHPIRELLDQDMAVLGLGGENE